MADARMIKMLRDHLSLSLPGLEKNKIHQSDQEILQQELSEYIELITNQAGNDQQNKSS